MKLSDITDFSYKPPTKDLSNIFDVEQIQNKDGSISTYYNINNGVVIDGIDELLGSEKYLYTVCDGDNLKLISYKLFGVTDYWWLIAKINGIEDILETLDAGDKLFVFPYGTMDLLLTMIKNAKETSA